MKTHKSLGKVCCTLLSIAAVCLAWLAMSMFGGCASIEPDISYRKSCWEVALGAAAGARYELGVDKKHIRIGIDDSAMLRVSHRIVGHAWCEVFYKGKWHRISDKGPWYTDSTWHDQFTADRYYTFDNALLRAMTFGPRKKE